MGKNYPVVTGIFCLLIAALACGCTSVAENEPGQATEPEQMTEFEQAIALMRSADEKLVPIERLEWSREDVEYITSRYMGAEGDLDEALTILYTIEPGDEDEKRMIYTYRALCIEIKDVCTLVRTSFADGMEHLFRARDYGDSGNTAGRESELQSAKTGFSGAHTASLKIQENVRGISPSDLRVEDQDLFTGLSTTVDGLVDTLDRLVDTLDNAG